MILKGIKMFRIVLGVFKGCICVGIIWEYDLLEIFYFDVVKWLYYKFLKVDWFFM